MIARILVSRAIILLTLFGLFFFWCFALSFLLVFCLVSSMCSLHAMKHSCTFLVVLSSLVLLATMEEGFSLAVTEVVVVPMYGHYARHLLLEIETSSLAPLSYFQLAKM